MSPTSVPLFLLLLLIGVMVMITIALLSLGRRLYARNVILYSAHRLQLRDKGQVAINKDGFLPCFRCEHILRIGVDGVGVAHLYCHLCEEIFPDSFAYDDDYDPSGGESLPAATSQPKSPSGPYLKRVV